MRAAHLPVLALAVRRQEEGSLPRADQYPYATHDPLLSFTAPSRGQEAQLTNLALPFPPRPVLLVQAHKGPGGGQRLVSRLGLEHGITAHDLLGLGEGSVGHGELPPRDADACAGQGPGKSSGLDQRAILEGVLGELGDGVQERLWRRPLVLGRFHYRKESHVLLSSWFGV